MNGWLRYLVLPPEVTQFEEAYLRRMNRIGLGFFWLHLPVLVGIAVANGTSALQATLLTLFLLLGTTLAYGALTKPRQVSMAYGFSSMCMGGLLVHIGQGPMQIEMHFYFFTLLALLAVFANPLVILTAAVTVALHHLLVWLIIPRSVFNYDASLWTVVVHALFVVLESVAACFVARSFFDNVIGLERIVKQRTSEVEHKNGAMRLVLDNVNQGLVTLNRDGTIASERSAVVDRWLGAPRPGVTFWDHIAAAAPQTGVQFQLGWEALLENEFLLELMLDQMPKRMVLDGQILGLAYQPIMDGDSLDKLLLVISDISAEVAREQAESEQRDLMNAVQKIIANRVTFVEFFREGSALVDQITTDWQGPLDVLRRHVHTLKGNAGTFGVLGIATLCHEIETRMAQDGGALSQQDREELLRRWQHFAAMVEPIVGKAGQRPIEIDEAEHSTILDGVLSGEPRRELARMITAWKLEPLQGRLEHFGDQARALCRRLGKVPLEVTIESNNLRLAGEYWSGFFSTFTHVVRNAVDHGMEEPEERRTAGKAKSGRITLRGYVSDAEFILSISDDGRGIAWDRVAQKARTAGLPCEGREDLVLALFADGISTKTEVTEVSGRGVGMGAVREACLRLGGAIRVESDTGRGTTFAFHFPASALAGPLAHRPPSLTTRPPLPPGFAKSPELERRA